MPSAKRRPARWAPPKTPATRPPLRRMLWAIQRLQHAEDAVLAGLAHELLPAGERGTQGAEARRVLGPGGQQPLQFSPH